MMKSLTALAALSLAASAPAFAQTLVIGGGLAEECYLAVEAGDGHTFQTERICTRALQEEALTRNNRVATYVNRGISRMRDGNFTTALSDFDVALRMDDELGEAHLNRGAVLIHQGQFNDALTALNRAIELETGDLHAAHYNRAIAKEQTGDVTGAYYDFQTAGELMPEWELVERQLSRFTVSNS